MNPVHIYRYSDMNENLMCYMLGVSLGYSITDTQELAFQVTNSRNGDMEYEFGLLPAGVEKPVVPLFYNLAWNGSFFDGAFETFYSVSSVSQAKHKNLYILSTGNSLNLGDLYAYIDVMYARGGLDALGLLTELNVAGSNEDGEIERMQNTGYLSFIAEMQYMLHPKWKLFAKGTYETAGIYKSYDGIGKGKYRAGRN